MRKRRSRPVLSLSATILVAVAVAGCGSDEYLHTVYPTGGVITYQGKPVEGATVSFHPVTPEMTKIPDGEQGPQIASPTSRTDAEGRFTLSSYYANDGVPAGDYKVTVIWAPPILAVGTDEELSDDDLASGEFGPVGRNRKAQDKLDGKYTDPSRTTLTASVQPDEPNDFTFALE